MEQKRFDRFDRCRPHSVTFGNTSKLLLTENDDEIILLFIQNISPILIG